MQRTDIKLFKAQRMTDRPEGGGYRSANEVQSGLLNELFSNISSYTHAGGGIALRKAFAGVDTLSTERYLGAHLIMASQPDDPKVAVVAFLAASDAEELASAKERVQSYRGRGLLLSTQLYGWQFAGQTALTLPSSSADKFEVGGVYYIAIEDREVDVDGRMWSYVGEYFRVTAITERSGYVEIGIEEPLTNTYPNQIQYQQSPNLYKTIVVIRATTTNVDTTRFAGVTRLAADIAPGSTSASVDAVRQPVVPVATDPTPLGEQPAFTPPEGVGATATIPHPRLSRRVISLPVATDPAAVVVTYSAPVSDYLSSAQAVYVSAGRSVWVTAHFDAGALRVTLPGLPDAGSTVQFVYVSTDDYLTARSSTQAVARNTIYKAAGQATGDETVDEWDGVAGRPLTDCAIFDDAGALWARVWATGNGVVSGGFTTQVIGTIDYAAATVTIDAGGTLITLSLAAATSTTAANGFTCYWDAGALATGISAAVFSVPMDLVPASLYIRAKTLGDVLISGSCSALGEISGDIEGELSAAGEVSVTFSLPVRRDSVVYDGVRNSSIPLPESLTGLAPIRLPLDGKVPIFRAADVVVIHRTLTTTLPSVTDGQLVDLGVEDVSFVDVTDADGESLWTPLDEHFSLDKATGVLTVSGDWAAFSAPFLVTATIEEMALLTGADAGGQLRFAAPISRAFPASDTLISTALPLGDLQAQVSALFSQQLWTAEWADERIGDPILAQYNDINHPIELSNRAAVTERWSLRFTGPSSFAVYGESRGLVAAGDTMNDIAPINPANGLPYFTLRAAGWGGGWATGNVLRFNTLSAFPGVWFLRTTQPGRPAVEYDDVQIQTRGNAD